MRKAEYKVSGGKLIKVQLTKKNNLIEKIKITGDFFLHPEESIESLEKELENQVLEEGKITSIIKSFLERHNAILLGAAPEDFARCIIMAGE